MSKKIVYFNDSRQIDTITIHYNNKIDSTFVEEVSTNIKEIAKKMGRKVDLKNPKDYYTIQVFVYPSKSLFNQIFGGEIEKRFYARKRSLEDLYVVKDSDGNIHIVSPRGMGKDKTDYMKKILVMKVLGEYMDEKEKLNVNRLLKAALKPKEEKEDKEEEKDEEDLDIEKEEIEEDEEELDDEKLHEIIETEEALEQIDAMEEEQENIEDEAQQENENEIEENEDTKEEKVEKKKAKEPSERKWLNYGWLAYVRGKLKKEKDTKEFATHISKKGIQKLKNLSNSKIFEEYNYSVEYACATVDFIITNYGMKKFVEYYENPKDLEKVFGTTKFKFNADLKAYIYSKYNLKEMKMEIDQKDLKEITEIQFGKSGGADITESTEITKSEQEKEINND